MNRVEDHDFSISNEDLLELCKQQDQDALRLLLRRHERPVYGLLYRMLSNHEDAEEALAEVFVKVWRGAAFFKGDAKFTTWLFKIASNTARDYLRSRKTRPEVYIEDTLESEVEKAERPGAAFVDPAKSAIDAESKAQIYEAMKSLSEEDRLLVSLYHFQELDYEEISKITGTPPSNLKVKLFRARQRLRKLCAALEEGDNQNELRTDTTEPSGLQQKAVEWS